MEKTPQGLFRASVENTNLQNKVKPVEDKDQQVAVRILGDRLNELYVKGEAD